MKILELIDKSDYDHHFDDMDPSDDEFVKYFELNGKITLKKDEGCWDQDGYSFYCGPSIGGGFVSDTVDIGRYLSRKVKILDVEAILFDMENYHTIHADNEIHADVSFSHLKRLIEADGYELDEG